uniref:Uncharacterized protein n=1 Tax=Arion vulgaris TaxID=1028688 RepID=A0A0B7ATU1_9EUPU
MFLGMQLAIFNMIYVAELVQPVLQDLNIKEHWFIMSWKLKYFGHIKHQCFRKSRKGGMVSLRCGRGRMEAAGY